MIYVYIFWSAIGSIFIILFIVLYRYFKMVSMKSSFSAYSKYIFAFMELEKKYVDYIFEKNNHKKLSRAEIKDTFRARVVNENDSLRNPDFPKESILKEIRKEAAKL